MVSLSRDVGTILLVRLEGISPAVDLIREHGVERLVSVAWEGRHEPALKAWAAADGDLGQLELIALGSQMRGRASVGNASLVRGVSVERIDRLPNVIEDAIQRESIEQAILFEGITELLCKGGLTTSYTVVQELLRTAESRRVMFVLAIPATAPEAIAAGLTHNFRDTLEPVGVAAANTVQPAGRLHGVTLETIYELIRPARRRVALRLLDNADGEMRVRQLAAQLAEQPIDAKYIDNPDRLSTVLHQVDLPKLADAGVIDFEPDRALASIRLEALQLWPFLDLSRRTGGV